MASKYEAPEEVNQERLKNLGKEVEMTTFKTNLKPEEDQGQSESNAEKILIKILCVGGYTGGLRTKGDFIKDYLQVQPPEGNQCTKPTIGVDFYLKTMKWGGSQTLALQLWDIAEQERFCSMCRVYYKEADGALVFWGPGNPNSLSDAQKWRESIGKYMDSRIPCVLITNNVSNLEFVGPGNTFENEGALTQFCEENDIATWFEIKSRDWVSGEESGFGRAVHRLLNEISKTGKTLPVTIG